MLPGNYNNRVMHAFRYSKIEKRLDFVYLPDTLQIQFMGAHQNHSEQLEDCTDKLLSLATKAFRDLPEDHIYTQAWRLCQCRFDKEAGKHTAMAKSKNIEEAIDKIKCYQHTTKAMFGKTVPKSERSDFNQIGAIRHRHR